MDAGYFFLEMLMEVGPVKSAPMGGVLAIDWMDIYSYCYGLPADVEHWERVLLLEMSRAYASGISEGSNPFSIAPVDRDTNETAP